MTKAVLVRQIRATPERVFDTCTEVELLALWLGPQPFVATQVEVDLTVGGRFRFRLRSDEGDYVAAGSYVEISRPSRIVMTWAWVETPDSTQGFEPSDSSIVTFDIQSAMHGSTLTLTHERLVDDAAADGLRQGWAEALDKLAALLASR